MNESNSPDVIRISPEEVASTRVDDLLKRQMSMRGEPGVTRDRARKWYYQNWLIFMLTGMIGAIVAWAILEPIFDDEQYIQGKITDLDLSDNMPDLVTGTNQKLRLRNPIDGSLRVNGEKIYLLKGLKEIPPGGGAVHVDPLELQNGETIGIYVTYHAGVDQDFSFASFIVRNPPPQSPKRAAMKISQLAARSSAASMMLFPLVAGLVGLAIGAADGVICRLPRRAILSGLVGLLVGAAGGFLSSIFANLAYSPLHHLAMAQMDGSDHLGAFGFVIQMGGRALAWALAGVAMGLGQGIALRSPRLLIYGLLGGVVGGLLGGLLFDPIDLILLGPDKPSAHWSRLIGFAVIGASVGGMIGVVELLARDAWLRMTQGPLMGKEFLLFKDVMNIGSSARSDLYLFNDPQVAKNHAAIRVMGDECELEVRDASAPVLVNTRPVLRTRLRHGDNISIGRTTFVFQRRKS